MSDNDNIITFTALTDEELKSESKNFLYAEGVAHFEVVLAQTKTSKKGNKYFNLKLKIWDSKGQEGFIFYNLSPAFKFGFKDFFKSTNKLSIYQKQQILDVELIGLSGKCILKTEKSEGYPDKTGVYKFIFEESDSKEPTDFTKDAPLFGPNDDVKF